MGVEEKGYSGVEGKGVVAFAGEVDEDDGGDMVGMGVAVVDVAEAAVRSRPLGCSARGVQRLQSCAAHVATTFTGRAQARASVAATRNGSRKNNITRRSWSLLIGREYQEGARWRPRCR